MQLEVSNYALKARSSREIKELERVITLRRIEMEDRKVPLAVQFFDRLLNSRNHAHNECIFALCSG